MGIKNLAHRLSLRLNTILCVGPLMDKWIKKMYLYTMEYELAIKRMKSCICNNVVGRYYEGIMLSEINQRVKDRNYMISLIYI